MMPLNAGWLLWMILCGGRCLYSFCYPFLAGRYGNDLEGDALSSATSYIAPLRVERLKKNSVMDYEYYLIIGSLDIIRKKVYEIRENKW